MADPDPDPDPSADTSNDIREHVDAWLEQTRWLYEDARFRYDSLGRQATTLLAISGVLLGLLSATATRDAHHPYLYIAAVSADVAAALLALWALRPRRLSFVRVSAFREQWLDAATAIAHSRDPDEGHVPRMIEAVLHGGPAAAEKGEGPLQELADATKKRGTVVFAASVAVTLAVSLVGVYVSIGALT